MLSENQLIAAGEIARGRTDKEAWEAAKVSKATLYRWKSQKNFQKIVTWSQDLLKSAITEAGLGQTDQAELDTAIQRDIALNEKLDQIAHKIADLSNDTLDEVEPEEVSVRVLPSLVKSLRDVIECQRQGLDRVNGLEGILYELEQIEKASTKMAMLTAQNN